jgi:hypothetical protein
MFGEPPVYESGMPDDSVVQKRLSSIVEENDLNRRGHELVIGAGYRGDAWLKTWFGTRHDMSALADYDGLEPPNDAPLEPMITSVIAENVFPEFADGSRKRLKAVNIAYEVAVTDAHGREEYVYLDVERHIPGYVIREKFMLDGGTYDECDGVHINTYTIGRQIGESVITPTGTSRLLMHHIPYKTDDERFWGVSGIEKMESLLAAINDRLVQIDYILLKHSDPTTYGPPLQDDGNTTVRLSGEYIEVDKADVTPGYMTWDGQLDAAFRQLDKLVSYVFLESETPQWVFGTTIAQGNEGGTGTSHTDGGAIKARFFPILSKVKRIRQSVDVALRDALYTAMLLDNSQNERVEGFVPYEVPYPKIRWKDGIPRNEREEAEIAQIRTGNKPTLDQMTAIKHLDDLDDMQAQEILDRIQDDEQRDAAIVTSQAASSAFNGEVA